jgi:hypothetical protein
VILALLPTKKGVSSLHLCRQDSLRKFSTPYSWFLIHQTNNFVFRPQTRYLGRNATHVLQSSKSEPVIDHSRQFLARETHSSPARIPEATENHLKHSNQQDTGPIGTEQIKSHKLPLGNKKNVGQSPYEFHNVLRFQNPILSSIHTPLSLYFIRKIIQK